MMLLVFVDKHQKLCPVPPVLGLKNMMLNCKQCVHDDHETKQRQEANVDSIPVVPVAVTVLPMKPYQKCRPGPTRTEPCRLTSGTEGFGMNHKMHARAICVAEVAAFCACMPERPGVDVDCTDANQSMQD